MLILLRRDVAIATSRHLKNRGESELRILSVENPFRKGGVRRYTLTFINPMSGQTHVGGSDISCEGYAEAVPLQSN